MAEAHWLEISVTVDGETAEAVAEVMSRYCPQGVVTEQSVKYNDAEDLGTPYGPIRVFGYLIVDENLEETKQKVVEGLWHLGQILNVPEPSFRPIEDQDWMVSWRKYYQPIEIGRRMLVLPAWIDNYDPNRIPVKIDPSMAFGTGTHPTTQLCMAMIEDYVKPGDNVIDVGCGSGILSIAAKKFGAAKVLAVDIDSASVISTRENSELNELAGQIEIGKGSVTEILEGNFSFQIAPVVIANILAPVIIHLFDDGLADLISAGGTIILSGILDEQEESVIQAALKKGLTHLETRNINDWVAIRFSK